MTWTILRRAVATSVLLASLAGCGSLDVSDPTAIQQSELDNAAGANLLRMDALIKFYQAFGTGVWQSAMITDETFNDTPPYFYQYGMTNYNELVDRRESEPYEMVGGIFYETLQRTRTAPTIAMGGLRSFVGPERVGEMFAVRGYTTLMLAEMICPGFPLHKLVGGKPVYGTPLTTDQVFEDALADFDSAIALSGDSARIENWARVGRARTLLGLGRYGEAAIEASSVPLLYAMYAEYNTGGGIFQANTLGTQLYDGGYSVNTSVSDHEGGNGLDFVSADDPRVQTTPGIYANDSVTQMFTPNKYPNNSADIVIASGIEARLIEAEAALAAGDVTVWWNKLNEPRRNGWSTIVPAVPGPLTDVPDPGNDAARLDLTMRERAFWLWGTGHRLGDMRRLVTRYGRGAESVYPTGTFRQGGTYSTATSIPFQASQEQQFSPTVTGCTSR